MASAYACQVVCNAVKAGKLPKVTTLDCVDCGKPAEHYDHRDYNKPLDVEPVCRSCNKKRGPAIKNDRDETVPIMVRLTETQFKKLERIADKNGMKPSQYMRYLFNTKGK